MAEPLFSPNVRRPVQWDRGGSSGRRRSGGGILGLLLNRRVILILLAVAALLIAGRYIGGEDEPPTELAPVPEDQADAQVAVRAALTRAGFPITVQVVDGSIILTGILPTPTESTAAEAVARSVGTDLPIVNQLDTEISLAEEQAVPLSDVTDADLALQHALSSLLARNPIIFESASPDIAEQSFITLNLLAAELSGTSVAILIAGHTDSDGEDEANLVLSQVRADAVATYLIEQGVNPERMTSQGFGEMHPIADNVTAEGKLANRRIDVLVQNESSVASSSDSGGDTPGS